MQEERNGLSQAQSTNGVFSSETPQPDNSDGHGHLTRTLIWVGIAGLSAALAFTVLRALLNRQPVDPTSRRIQQLIDEANQLLRTLDEQKSTNP
ncbi:MAG: hypothetical protein JO233_04910 [Candidatus Eremiobacteraeota bacterium]|nr:hypothetical protein [Candidatus Eremiobacteraeota bacterium]